MRNEIIAKTIIIAKENSKTVPSIGIFTVGILVEKARVEAATVTNSGDAIRASQKLQRFNIKRPIPATIEAILSMTKVHKSDACPIENINRKMPAAI